MIDYKINDENELVIREPSPDNDNCGIFVLYQNTDDPHILADSGFTCVYVQLKPILEWVKQCRPDLLK